MDRRPKLVLVTGCGMNLPRSATRPARRRVNVGTHFVPTDTLGGSGLDIEDPLSGDAPLIVEPLPDHSLRHPDLGSKRGLADAVGFEVVGQVHGDDILATLVGKVNSKLLDNAKDARHGRAMATNKRPKPGDGIPDEVKIAEGKALAALWKARSWRSQEKFAEEMKFSQGNFSHYVGGRRPIPMDVALAVTKELKCRLEDFSDRLAKEHAKARATRLVKWPFVDILPQQLARLTPGQLKRAEGALMEELERIASQTHERAADQ